MFEDEEDSDKKDKKRKRRYDDIFKEIQKMMEKMFSDPNFFDELLGEDEFPKFKTPSGDEFFRPLIMGWSVHIGPDGKPVLRKFGHTSDKPEKEKPFTDSREPIIDLLNQDNEIVLIIETPGVEKKDIKLKTTENEVTVTAGSKFKKKISLPEEITPNESKATYNNGLLEIRLPKKNRAKSGPTTINID